MIGTGTAILLSALAGGAATAYGASKAASAAKEAAATQSAAVDKATALQLQANKDTLDFMKSQAATANANMAPWLATGKSALGALTYGMGLKVPADWGQVTAATPQAPAAPAPTTPVTPPVAAPRPGRMPGDEFDTRARIALPGYRRTPENAQPGPVAEPVVAPSAPEPMVPMMAPDGSRRSVPQSQVKYYQSLGATVIGG